FFFSSRRRHTRLQGDWSSDVCSSDLASSRRSSVWTRVPTTFLGPTDSIAGSLWAYLPNFAPWLLWASPSLQPVHVESDWEGFCPQTFNGVFHLDPFPGIAV